MSSKDDAPRLKRIATGDLAMGLRVLADLLDAGMSANRALSSLHHLTTGPLREALPEVQRSVQQGRSVASALADARVAIPPIVIGVIHAGENGGGLSAAVRRAAEIMEETAALRSALIGALAYPALLLASGTASVVVLTVIVLPRFAAILGDMGQSLPRTTVLVLDAASLARAMLVPAIVTGMVLLVAWHLWTSTEDGRRRWHSMLLATPLLGPVRLATGTGRGCAALAALLDNGLPLASALPLAGRATGDVALARRFSDARQLLMRGSSLGHALRDSMSVSETAIRLARAGEESGRLASMIGHAAHLERTRATRLTQTAVRIIEPLLIVFFGGAVAIVAGALLQAVYSVRPT